MSCSIAEYAGNVGISVQRARELARRGLISAHREGRSWVVDSGDRRPTSRRPLSPQSRADLIAYLNSQSFGEVSGHSRSRLAERLRALARSDEPAQLLREYFGSHVPSGRGGAAIVRAAQAGMDEQVCRVLMLEQRQALTSYEEVARKLRDLIALRGTSLPEVARQSGVAVSILRRIESGKPVRNPNLLAARAFNALNYSPARIRMAEATAA